MQYGTEQVIGNGEFCAYIFLNNRDDPYDSVLCAGTIASNPQGTTATGTEKCPLLCTQLMASWEFVKCKWPELKCGECPKCVALRLKSE